MSEERFVARDPRVVLHVLPALGLLVLGVVWLLAAAGPWSWAGAALVVAGVVLGAETVRADLVVVDDTGVRHPGARALEWPAVAGIEVLADRRGRTAWLVGEGTERPLVGEDWRIRPEVSFDGLVARCRLWQQAAAGSAPRHALPSGRPRWRAPRSRPRNGLGERRVSD